MLARLQAVLVMTAVLAALAWSAWCWQQGVAPGWWLAGLGLALAPHAPLLALEFVLLASVGRDAAVPSATTAQLLHAWAAEVLSGWRVFGWRQPFAAHAEADVPGQPGRTGVLLLHGYVCNRGVWAPWLRRFRVQGVPCQAITLLPVFGSIDGCLPQVAAAVQALTQQTGRPPLLVGHSMGGLVARAWLLGPTAGQAVGQTAGQAAGLAADISPVAGVVTIATPHHGTWLARFGSTTNARQMRQHSAWLQALAAREPAGHATHFTCFYGNADNIVFPASSAMLAGADNRHLPGVAHVDMVFAPAVLALVLQRLQAIDRAGQPHG